MIYSYIFLYKYVVFVLKNLLKRFQRVLIYKKLDPAVVDHLLEGLVDYNEPDHAKNFFEIDFAGFSNIVVVGPQRSGTTFTAKVLAARLKFRYVDEIDFLINDAYLFKRQLKLSGSVIQAPGLTHLIHEMVGESTLVIYMRRASKDILKSVRNKNGFLTHQIFSINQSKFLRRRYPLDPCVRNILNEIDENELYIDTMLKIWHSCQSIRIKHQVELNYESLKFHPLWLDKKHRKGFHSKQVGIET